MLNFLAAFFAVLLLREKQKTASDVFCITLYLQNEWKTSE